MKVFKLNPNNPDMDLINEAINILSIGGVILYPTDTVYGLGANIFDKFAVKRIYNIKKDYKSIQSFAISIGGAGRGIQWVTRLSLFCQVMPYLVLSYNSSTDICCLLSLPTSTNTRTLV